MSLATGDLVAAVRDFNRFYTNLIGVLDRHFLESAFSLMEVRILYEIAHSPQTTGRKLSQGLRVDEGYLSRTVNRLVERGLVSRSKSKDDGRTRLLELSPKGRKVFRELDRRSAEAISALLDPLSDAERARLRRLLRQVQLLLSKGETP